MELSSQECTPTQGGCCRCWVLPLLGVAANGCCRCCACPWTAQHPLSPNSQASVARLAHVLPQQVEAAQCLPFIAAPGHQLRWTQTVGSWQLPWIVADVCCSCHRLFVQGPLC